MQNIANRTPITLLTVILPVFIGISLFSLNYAAAQRVQNDSLNSQPNNGALTTYQDPIYGFMIDYPSDWKKVEGYNFVEFQLPDGYTNSTNSSLIALEIKIDPLPPNITSLDKYTRAKLIPHRQPGQFDLIELNRTTIAENFPAIKTVYTNTFPNTGTTLKTMEITMVKDNLGYDIRYFADPAANYLQYLPFVQKILASFEFIGLT